MQSSSYFHLLYHMIGWLLVKSPAATILAIPGYYILKARPPLRSSVIFRLTSATLPYFFFAATVCAVVACSSRLVFLDHGEPNVIIIGARWSHGLDPYPATNQGFLYGLGYGPVVFWFVSWLWPYTQSPGALRSLLAAPVLLGLVVYWLAIRSHAHSDLAFAALGAILGFLLALYPAFIWIRPDPLIIATALLVAACLVPETRSLWWSAIAGVLIGVLAGLKLNLLAMVGLVGVFPQKGWRDLALAGSAACVVSAAIYLGQIPDVRTYWPYIRIYLAHGMALDLLLANILILVSLWFGLFALTDISSKQQPLLISLGLASCLAIGISGAKQGAGPHHLLAVVPLLLGCIVANVGLLSSKIEDARTLLSLLTASLLLPIAVGTLPLVLMTNASHMLDRKREALDGIVARLGPRNVMVLTAGPKTYEQSFLRYVPAVEGGPVLVDPFSLMDANFAGIDQTAAARRLRACYSEYVVLPMGEEALSLTNNYTGKPLFAPVFKDAFRSSYGIVEHDDGWSVYKCFGTQSRTH